MAIQFFLANEHPYGCFCNFSLHGFELDDLWWQTSEHYYQAQKFAGKPYAETIRLAKTPADAAKLGHVYLHRNDWKKVKYEIMRKAVLRKFQTHANIRNILLNTGNEAIVQKDLGDYYWGCGEDGSGHNYLGKVLMEVRNTLRSTTANNVQELREVLKY